MTNTELNQVEQGYQALKDIINAAEGGDPYNPTELLEPNFTQVLEGLREVLLNHGRVPNGEHR